MPIVGHSIKDICNKKARSSVRDGISTPITNIFQKHRHIHTHRHKHSHTQAQTHSHTQTHPHTNTNATSTNFNYYLNHICLSSRTPSPHYISISAHPKLTQTRVLLRTSYFSFTCYLYCRIKHDQIYNTLPTAKVGDKIASTKKTSIPPRLQYNTCM